MNAPKGPSPTGRAIAGIVGFSLSATFVYYMFSDYQLIRKEPPRIEYDEDGNPIRQKFKVSFREVQPLRLKPEVADKVRAQQEEMRLLEERQQQEKELLKAQQTSTEK